MPAYSSASALEDSAMKYGRPNCRGKWTALVRTDTATMRVAMATLRSEI
jgi:hypothetical protein